MFLDPKIGGNLCQNIFEVCTFWSITGKECIYSGSNLHSDFLETLPKDSDKYDQILNTAGVAIFNTFRLYDNTFLEQTINFQVSARKRYCKEIEMFD